MIGFYQLKTVLYYTLYSQQTLHVGCDVVEQRKIGKILNKKKCIIKNMINLILHHVCQPGQFKRVKYIQFSILCSAKIKETLNQNTKDWLNYTHFYFLNL